jgi:hypothetical protein
MAGRIQYPRRRCGCGLKLHPGTTAGSTAVLAGSREVRAPGTSGACYPPWMPAHQVPAAAGGHDWAPSRP